MRVQEGRLEALPHPSSIASLSDKGAELWDHSMSAAAQQCVDDEGNGGGETATDRWFCFQELSQVEDHYSLSGLSRVPVSAMLLLCGEGDLVVREAEGGSQGMSSDHNSEQANGKTAGAGSAFSDWWAMATGSRGDASRGKEASQPRERRSDDVVLSIPELGDWFGVRLKREAASRVQALRAMLRFLFRVYCCEPSRWQEIVAEGKTAALVLDMAERIIRAEAGQSDAPSPVSKPSSAHAPSGNASASTSRADHAVRSHGRASASDVAPGRAQGDKRATGRNKAQPAESMQRQNQSFYSASSTGRTAEAEPGKVKGMYSAEAWEADGGQVDNGKLKSSSSKHNQPFKAASSGQTSERKSRVSAQSTAATYPKSGGSLAGFQCGLCFSIKAEKEGCTDFTDGSWYCWDCWNSYYAAQKPVPSSSWSWSSSWY